MPSLDFGDVQLNTQATAQVTLTSSGTAPVTISSTAIAGAQFGITSSSFPPGITGLPATLNPGQQMTLTVSFLPTATGAVTGDLTVSSNASGAATNVALTGNGVPAPAPKLVLSATTLNFGSTQLGSTTTKTLTITSSGAAPLAINQIAITGTQFTDGSPSLPVTLPPGQQIVLTLNFDPNSPGADAQTLTITSNATPANVSVSLSGTGTTSTTPQLTASAASLNFGTVTVNSGATQSLTLTSSGTAPVTISATTVSGVAYTVSGSALPLTLNPGQAATLQVTFDPTVAGAAAGNLAITSNASGGLLQVALNGTGAAITTPQLTASATSVSFGNVTLNSGVTQSLTLTSSGTALVTISATTVSGAGYTVSGAPLPVTLNPGQTTTLQLTFDPTIAGASTGNLTISSDATSGAIQVALSGTGIVPASPQLTVSPASLAFGSVTLNTTSSLPVTLSSTGTAPVTVSAATLSGAGFVASGAAFPVTINPGLAVTIQVQFDPTVAGAASGQLTVTSNSASNGTVVVQITGTGMAVQHSIDLSWNAPTTSTDPVAGYNIYRSTDGGATFTRLNTSPETALVYTDSNVQSGTTYTYVAKSVDASGQESGPSNQISLPVP